MRALVVVRCGDSSIHRSWAFAPAGVDIAVSYFGDDPDCAFPEARFVHRAKGGKWDQIVAFFLERPELRTAYDYYWFPDDDLLGAETTLADLFAAAEAHALDLFQPALDSWSYYSHLGTLQSPRFRLRHTSLVEVMAIGMSRRLFDTVFPLFAETRSGFGLDFLIAARAAALPGAKGRNIGVIDSVPVRHTRPMGGPLQALIKTSGPGPMEELQAAVDQIEGPKPSRINGVAVPRTATHGGILLNGAAVGPVRVGCLSLVDLLISARNQVQPPSPLAALRYAAKTALARRGVVRAG